MSCDAEMKRRRSTRTCSLTYFSPYVPHLPFLTFCSLPSFPLSPFSSLPFSSLPFSTCCPCFLLVSPLPRVSLILSSLLPNQCLQCGLRAPASRKGKERLDTHLDWHFRLNKRTRESEGRGNSRAWFVDVKVRLGGVLCSSPFFSSPFFSSPSFLLLYSFPFLHFSFFSHFVSIW